MSKHTLGEWKQQGITIYAVDGGVICQLSEPRASALIEHHPLGLSSKDWKEAMANGYLITAAPDLLEALKACDAALRHHPAGDNRSDEDIAKTSTAIAKATERPDA